MPGAELDMEALLRGLARCEIGIALLDPQGGLQYANPAFQALDAASAAAAHETPFDGWRLLVAARPAAPALPAPPAAPAPDDPALRRAIEAVDDARHRRRPLTLALLALDDLTADAPARQRFARQCHHHLRPADHLAPWPGGFLLLLPGAGLHMSASVVQRLRHSLRLTPAGGGHADAHTTFCAGLAELGAEESVEALLQRAGRALEAARRKGRNTSMLAAPGA